MKFALLLRTSRTADSPAARERVGSSGGFAPRLAACALLTALGVCASAETWNGTLVDVMCKGKDLASHTRQCAVNCAKGGFGLVLPDGKFVKFDETGNTKALAVLKSSSKEKDIKAKVTGALDGDVIKVEAVELQP